MRVCHYIAELENIIINSSPVKSLNAVDSTLQELKYTLTNYCCIHTLLFLSDVVYLRFKNVEEAISKAKSLIEAMEYIREFRGRIVVVKLGGSVLDDDALRKELLIDVAFMSTVGIQPIIVHGGGKTITKAMNEAGIEAAWVQGLRYTDERTLTIAEHTLVHKVNTPICETLTELGCQSTGMHSLSSCVLFAEQMRLTGEDGRKLDIGLVGKVAEVNGHLLKTLCGSDTIPVIAPLAQDKAGGKLNVNADIAAGEVAAAVQAEKLVMVSDTHGILKDVNDADSRFSTLDETQIKKMIDDGIITQAMFPKVEACLKALDAGVKKAHIIDGRIEHSLLLEIYTDKGIGTQIVKK